jgi:uncharacterized protein YkwD
MTRRFFSALIAAAFLSHVPALADPPITPNRLVQKQCKNGVCSLSYIGSAEENSVIDIHNRERMARGLTPLKVNKRLMDFARSWSNTQAGRRRMYHSGGPYAENVAVGQPTPESVAQAWLKSPGHYRNWMTPSHREIGVGAVRGPNGSIYWTTVFSK